MNKFPLIYQNLRNQSVTLFTQKWRQIVKAWLGYSGSYRLQVHPVILIAACMKACSEIAPSKVSCLL